MLVSFEAISKCYCNVMVVSIQSSTINKLSVTLCLNCLMKTNVTQYCYYIHAICILHHKNMLSYVCLPNQLVKEKNILFCLGLFISMLILSSCTIALKPNRLGPAIMLCIIARCGEEKNFNFCLG